MESTPAPKRTRRPRRLRAKQKPLLSVPQILAWADSHFERTGQWPKATTGWIRESAFDKWCTIDTALQRGLRGLSGSTSLARLLAEYRGVRNLARLPRYSIDQILSWADAHKKRTGQWPDLQSGPIAEAPGETWHAVHAALSRGNRGLPGKSSLARLLADHRGVRNIHALPRLSVQHILAWADAYYERHGRWPKHTSGAIEGTAGETWSSINYALYEGVRGLRGGTRLAVLLAKHRGRRHHLRLPRLSERKILAWADAHHARTGKWPAVTSGHVVEAPAEEWRAINSALVVGLRGLPGSSSLAKLLEKHRNTRNSRRPPKLTVSEILQWADAYHRRTNRWPAVASGPIPEAPGETWRTVANALRRGTRRLRRTMTLRRLLAEHRGRQCLLTKPPLKRSMIVRWAKAHYQRTGRWPSSRSGAVTDAPGETWCGIYNALLCGYRGLPRSSLRKICREAGEQ